MSADGKSVFAVGSDRTLKELSNCQIVHDVSSANKANPAEVVLTQVCAWLPWWLLSLLPLTLCVLQYLFHNIICVTLTRVVI